MDISSYRSPRLRAKIATAAFVLYGAGVIASLVMLWDAHGIAQQVVAGGHVDSAAFDDLDRRAYEVQIAGYLLLAVAAIGFCVWTYRVVANGAALSGGRGTISPGWAVGYHFIPIVNWWRPYVALSEAWTGSDPEARGQASAGRGSALLLVWWIVWVASRYAIRLVTRGEAQDAQEWVSDIRKTMLMLCFEAVALVLAIAVVWKLTRRQEACAAAVIAPARVEQGGA